MAYESRASNLNSLDTGTFSDIYVYHVFGGSNTLVNVNQDGNGGGNGDSQQPTISASGNMIAYHSRATNLHPLDFNPANYHDVFARNLTTNTTILVSINQAGTSSVAGSSLSQPLRAGQRRRVSQQCLGVGAVEVAGVAANGCLRPQFVDRRD